METGIYIGVAVNIIYDRGEPMRKIALIMDGWKRFFTFAWPAGILQRIRESGEEANLYIFNSSGDWSRDEDYNTGEYNIYRLPNLEDFDGIIVDLNNIRYPEVRRYVTEHTRATGKPVISIANEMDGFYYVGIDNYTAMREVIAHLYGHHNCRRFRFLMGPKDNYENKVRVAALQDFLKEKGIVCQPTDFYYESYEYKCGVNGFLRMLEGSGGAASFDAVICANDNIAVGVCETAAKHGFCVPDDFFVTGFDNFDKASYYSPHITTVSHVREEVGYRCADILIKLWNGQNMPRFNFTEHQCIFWESCGCAPDVKIRQEEHARSQIMYEIETDEFEEQVLSLEYELLQCETVEEMSQWIPKCIPAMKCDAMYLVLDEHMDDFRSCQDYYDRHLIEDEEFCVQGYPESMRIGFAYENGEIKDCVTQRITALFPMFEADTGGTDFLFLPLHFRERTVGYFVIRNAVYLMEKQFLFQVINVLTSAMENLHKKEKLAYLNKVLSDLYVKDAMTGMYNRLGYQKLVCSLFEDKRRKKENMSIVFIDMDRLKYINDCFGHIHGDWAIKTTANAILNHIPKGAAAVRTGGDEFLIVQKQICADEVCDMVQQIRDEIRMRSEEMKFGFPLTISAGCIDTDMFSDKSLDDYVREADEVMYQEKLAKKVNRK